MRLKFAFIFFVLSCFAFGQNALAIRYKHFKQTKPKYKKTIIKKIEPDGDTIVEQETAWKRNKVISIWHNNGPFVGSCAYQTTITKYSFFKPNVVIAKYYNCNTFSNSTIKIYTHDSIIFMNDKKEITFKSVRNATNSGWTWKNGEITETSNGDTVWSYRNDTLIEKQISYRYKQKDDSILYFNSNNKLINKLIFIYNSNGDCVLHIQINYENDIPVNTIKSTTAYEYDNKNNWIKKTEHKEETALDSDYTTTYLRTIIY